jgi:periplasmic protein TonB
MGQPAYVLDPVAQTARKYPSLVPARIEPSFAFRSLVLTEPRSLAKGRRLTLAASIVLHGALVIGLILVPILFFEDALPAPGQVVRAFFAAPAELAPAPPPPPPPPASTRAKVQATPTARPPEPGRLLAPVEVPESIPVEEGIDLGVEGGVPGGVEGGVPGGMVGGIIGGLPREAPEPPRAVVRVGGNIRAPKLVHEVRPDYPPLAVQARVSGMVILEAHVGTDGRVRSVRVLRSIPLLDEAAIEAVKQRRYQPLLLNGVPTEFILTMTMSFKLTTPVPGS